MNKMFCVPFTNQVTVTYRDKVEGAVRVFEDKSAPSLEHVINYDGVWVLPQETKETVAKKREQRYQELGADELLNNIIRDERLGRDVTEMQLEWESIQMQVREELPYPELPKAEDVQSYYQPLTPPTEPTV